MTYYLISLDFKVNAANVDEATVKAHEFLKGYGLSGVFSMLSNPSSLVSHLTIKASLDDEGKPI